MSKFPTSITKDYTIPANTAMEVAVGGKTVRVLSSSAAYKIAMEDQKETMDVEAGLRFTLEEGKFEFLTLINETGVAITTRLFIGYGDMADSRLSLTGGNLGVINGDGFLRIKETYNPSAPSVFSVGTVNVGKPVGNNGFVLQNMGAGILYLNTNGAATVGNGFIIKPGETIELHTRFSIGLISSSKCEVRMFTLDTANY